MYENDFQIKSFKSGLLYILACLRQKKNEGVTSAFGILSRTDSQCLKTTKNISLGNTELIKYLNLNIAKMKDLASLTIKKNAIFKQCGILDMIYQ